jgi:hypothetical protein
MAKILKTKGQYKSEHFSNALGKLGLKPSDGGDPFKAGKNSAGVLGKVRHTAVSHFIKGSEAASVSFEEIVQVKHVVDNLVSCCVKKKV